MNLEVQKYFYKRSVENIGANESQEVEVLANLSIHFCEGTEDSLHTVSVKIPYTDYQTYTFPNIPKTLQLLPTGDSTFQLTRAQFDEYCCRVQQGESIFTLDLDNPIQE